MNILFYSTKKFEQPFLLQSNADGYAANMTEKTLSIETAPMAKGFQAISVFTGDDLSAPVIRRLKEEGVKHIAVRAAGYDNVDIAAAQEAGINVANVPDYSPYAIAEHALAMMLALERKLVIANAQVHQQNFKLDNLVGFNLHGKTIGIIGTGKIGGTLAKILKGFGCRLLGYDILQRNELSYKYGLEYVSLPVLCREADIISIHTPSNTHTKYLIDKKLLSLMKTGVMLINTSRGACVNTQDVLEYLQNGHIGYFGTDVYEKEKGLFFYDHSNSMLNDDLLKKLLSLPNVLITPHQAFATQEALTNIAQTTFENIACWANGNESKNELTKRKADHINQLNVPLYGAIV